MQRVSKIILSVGIVLELAWVILLTIFTGCFALVVETCQESSAPKLIGFCGCASWGGFAQELLLMLAPLLLTLIILFVLHKKGKF